MLRGIAGMLLLASALSAVGCRSRPRLPPPSAGAPVGPMGSAAAPSAPERSTAETPAADSVRLAAHGAGSELLPPPEPLDEAPPLTLAQAVALGLQSNPRLYEAAARVQSARANAQIAYAPFLPTVGTSYRYSAFSQPVLPGGAFVPASLNSGVTSFNIAEAGIQWTLYDFGRTAGRYAQAEDRQRIEELTLTRARQTVAYEVAQTYFQILAADAHLRVRQEAHVQAKAILDDTKARLLGGVVEREAVLRAEVEVTRTEEQLLGAWQIVQDTQSTLSVLLGRSAAIALRVTAIEAEPAFHLSLAECLEYAALNRREISIARQAVAEANSGIAAAQGEFMPKIYVRGTVLRADSPGPLNAWVEGAGIHVDQPIYTGGAHRGELRRNVAEEAAARAALRNVLDQVSLQVSLSYRAIATDLERIRLGDRAISQSRENLRLTRVKYDNGNATPTDVVDAQTAFIQAQTSFFTAIYDYLSELARLEYAMGNGQQRLIEALEAARPVPPELLPAPDQARAVDARAGGYQGAS